MPRTAPTRSEVASADRTFGSDIALSIEKQIKLKRSIEIEVYLREMAAKLAEPAVELKDAPLGVYLTNGHRGSGARNFSFPGNRIYIQTQWLHRIEFEHELAAGIAVQLGHLRLRHLMLGLSEDALPTHPWDGLHRFYSLGDNWRQLFDFRADQRIDASKEAIDLLYASGFDPRGVVLYWEKMVETKEFNIEEEEFEKWLGRIRVSVAQLPPIKNPLIKSTRFTVLQKKFRQL